MTNLFNDIKDEIISSIESLGISAEGLLDRLTVEPPRDPSHGDMATNAAMVLSKAAGKNPRELAQDIKKSLEESDKITEISIAGPGFINLRLQDSLWLDQVNHILETGNNYGRANFGNGRKVNVEFVSANPTGPMHVGHTRGAVYGDVLCRLMEFMGYDVVREYYINDGGAQVIKLAKSSYLRYREALGEDIGDIPEGMYPGDYLVPVGKALAEKYGDALLAQSEEEWLEPVMSFAIEQMMILIKKDLRSLGVEHHVFSSERAMMTSGKVEEAIEHLDKKGLLYTGVLEPPKGKAPDDWEPRPQLLFKSSEFGDDIDRPLKKSDGSNTYLTNDIAYHYDKIQRTGPYLIDVLGADHAGYVKRIQASVKAMTDGKGECEVCLTNLIKLMRDGESVKMSKRSGTFETLRDVVEAVGKDVLRFMLLTRKHDQTIDFDLDKVKEQSKDNPVFYVQYCHARCCSVFRNALEIFDENELAAEALKDADLSLLQDESELGLIKLMATYPRQLEQAVQAREPHRLAFFVYEIAAAFHSLWNKGSDNVSLRFLDAENKKLTYARLSLVKSVAILVSSCLNIFGVTPVEEMH